MRFIYKAQKANGEFYEGERDASDRFALARELRAQGEIPIVVREEKGRFHVDLSRFIPRRVSMHDKIIFVRNLGGMLGAGLSLSRALSVLERQTRSERLRQAIGELNSSISTGSNLHEALLRFPKLFPELMVSMVEAGEEGGNLSASLFAVAEEMDRSYFLQRKVRGALMYPAVVVTAMIVVGVLMFIYVVPGLTQSFREFGIELPFTTRVVIFVSDFLSNHLLTGLAGLALAVVLLLAAARSPKGRRAIEWCLLRLPVVSPLIKESAAARTGQTLSSLLSAGVNVITALGITEHVLRNSYYKAVIAEAKDAIQKGDPMSAVFRNHEDIYPPFLSEMVAVGEETGKLSAMLKECGVFFQTEVEQKTKDLSTIIEPVLMVVVGVVVGFFAIAMISPAYSLMNSI